MIDTLVHPITLTAATLVFYVWTSASLHAVFRKAGEEGWQAWVPILNVIVLLRLGGLSGWWALLLVVPGAGSVALAVAVWVACSRINRAFGVGSGMTVVAILLFPVWSSVLGWGSARWLGSEQERAPGPVRSGRTGELEARVPAPAYGGPDASALPPRPPLPVASAAAPLAAAPPRPADPPAVVTHVSSATPSSHGMDDARPVSTPRRRSTAEHAVALSADPSSPAGTGADGEAVAPYTGTVPTVGASAPLGPRRAARNESADDSDEHLLPPRAAPGPRVGPNGTPVDPWAPPFDDLPPMRTPRYSPGPADGGFSDTSAEVSAVAGAPALGVPLPARSSVSSLRDEPELPDAEGAFDETIIATRRRTAWMLTPPLGAPIPVTSDVLIVGRRPSSDPEFSHAQLVPVADETRTMSKTHARLQLDGDGWLITDLDSTNGVVLVRADGSEVELAPGQPELATETFLLGDAELRLTRAHGAG